MTDYISAKQRLTFQCSLRALKKDSIKEALLGIATLTLIMIALITNTYIDEREEKMKESTTHYYLRELQNKVATLEEIAALTSVNKSTLESLLAEPSLDASDENFKRILGAWVYKVYLNN